MKFYVTEEEKRLIDEKMKQLPIKQYGAYFRKMAIDGYILVVDRSDTKAYIRELQAVSRNINQIAKRANATGTVYRQDIEDIKKAVDEIWRLQRRTLLRCLDVWGVAARCPYHRTWSIREVDLSAGRHLD